VLAWVLGFPRSSYVGEAVDVDALRWALLVGIAIGMPAV
jgi:hypothetical protein